MAYSDEFKSLISDSQKFKLIMAGSFITGDKLTIKTWEGIRRFSVSLVNHNGSILDIGCANGFFLRSIMEWSKYTLVPYGIDPEYGLIKQAGVLFPKYKSNFVNLRVEELGNLKKMGIPEKYDFIHFGVWDNYTINREHIAVIKGVLDCVKKGGRLILRFDMKSKKDNESKIKRLEPAFKVAGILSNPQKHSEIACWIEK